MRESVVAGDEKVHGVNVNEEDNALSKVEVRSFLHMIPSWNFHVIEEENLRYLDNAYSKSHDTFK